MTNSQFVAVSFSSKCFTAQRQFDKDREDGIVGFLAQRPECDADGMFAPYRCIPGQT
jgi:hypothetical protein